MCWIATFERSIVLLKISYPRPAILFSRQTEMILELFIVALGKRISLLAWNTVLLIGKLFPSFSPFAL
jgi:hypothetical protein